MITKVKNIANTEDKKRLLGNFVSLSVLQVFTYILPLITFPYLVKVLGVEKFGLVAFATSFISFFNILVDYGFNLSATREIAVNRVDKDKITEIYSSVITIKLILIVISLMILSIIVYSFDKFKTHEMLYFIAFIIVIGQALFPVWYFQGMEKMKYIIMVNIASKVMFTIAIFVFVHKESDYLLVPLLTGLGSLVGSIYALYIVRKQFNQKFKYQSLTTLKKYFKDSSQFFLSRVSVSVYTSANTFVLGFFTNNTMIGYYAIAEKIYQALQGVYSPIIQTIYPYLSSTKNYYAYKKLFQIVVSINLLVVIFILSLHVSILDIIFNVKSIEINNVLSILIMSSILHIPAILLGYPLLAAFGFPKYANLTVVQSSLVHIVGLGWLAITNNINIYSVSIMVVLTEATVFLTRFYYAKKMKLIFKGV